jgi:hypothetical protein
VAIGGSSKSGNRHSGAVFSDIGFRCGRSQAAPQRGYFRHESTGAIRRSILGAITKNDSAVCADLSTDHGIVDDANALYVRGFNGRSPKTRSERGRTGNKHILLTSRPLVHWSRSGS